jgi:hypothetical protein
MLSGETWSGLRLLGLNKFDLKMARCNANVVKLQSSCATERIISGGDNRVGSLRNQMVDLDLRHSRRVLLLRLLEIVRVSGDGGRFDGQRRGIYIL